MIQYLNSVPYYIDPILRRELDKIKFAVRNKDRDYVLCIDGCEGSGKSVLAQQIGQYLDDNFSLTKIVFNSDQFLDAIKKLPKYSCVVLDEAFSASNSRASLTEVNRAMVAAATEMRQRNLFIIFVIPSFFDLDKYFAIWRCQSLIHLYFNPDGSRGPYVIFPRNAKKLLYINGKKYYDYNRPRSPFPPCRFEKYYTVDESEYRQKKSDAFKNRSVTNLAMKWKAQRNALIKHMYQEHVATRTISEIIKAGSGYGLCVREVERIVQLNEKVDDDIETDSTTDINNNHLSTGSPVPNDE